MATNKPMLKYRVVSGRNPKTGGVLLRPVITERETLYMDQVVNYALNAGYVRGQFHDMRGALNGFVEAVQQLGKDGKAVNLNNWLRIHAELTGTVGQSRQLTNKNELHVAITALTDLKANISDFNWTNIDDDGLLMQIESITSPNGAKDEITKSKTIVANGKNLSFNAAWGDKVLVSYKVDDEEKTMELVPTEQSETYLRFEWPEELTEVSLDTELTFIFRLHGSEEGIEQEVTRTAKLV